MWVVCPYCQGSKVASCIYKGKPFTDKCGMCSGLGRVEDFPEFHQPPEPLKERKAKRRSALYGQPWHNVHRREAKKLRSEGHPNLLTGEDDW